MARPPAAALSPSLLPYADGWEVESSSWLRAKSSSFEEDYEWEKMEEVKEGEAEVAQRVIEPEDFVAAADKVKRHAFELARRLLEVEAEVERQRASLGGLPDYSLF
jgi:hypothetical protein